MIVVAIAGWLLPTLLRARRPAHEAECLAHLKQVGYAVRMYMADNDYRMPPRRDWHNSIRSYVDTPDDEVMRVIPGSRRDPLKCPLDPSPATCSYLYLDRDVLDYTMSRLNDSVTPLAVDEYFHEKATLVYYDGHVDKMPKTQWAYDRLMQWKIRRDLDHPESYAYELIPGTQKSPSFAPPPIERTERYLWPVF